MVVFGADEGCGGGSSVCRQLSKCRLFTAAAAAGESPADAATVSLVLIVHTAAQGCAGFLFFPDKAWSRCPCSVIREGERERESERTIGRGGGKHGSLRPAAAASESCEFVGFVVTVNSPVINHPPPVTTTRVVSSSYQLVRSWCEHFRRVKSRNNF